MVDGPPDEAYGRVTNPERFAAVHDAARTLIGELIETFDVDVMTGPDVDDAMALRSPGAEFLETIRLAPREATASTATFGFTPFPAVFVHAGRSLSYVYPRCGCDACDDQPDEVIADLRREIDALTAGRVTEKWDGARHHTATVYEGGSSASGWTLVEGDRARLLGAPYEHTWAAWPPAPGPSEPGSA